MDVIWHYVNVPPNAHKLLKAHLRGLTKTLYIPLEIPSIASPVIGGSGDVCSST